MPPRVMSPNRREMDQLAVSQREGGVTESITSSGSSRRRESVSSMNAEGSASAPGLMERVREFLRTRQQAQQRGVIAPQGSVDPVNVPVPDDGDVPEEGAPSLTSDREKCGVCERSFRYRGPVVTCAGCTKRVHNQYCVKDVRLGTAFQMSMCHTCCIQVEDLVEEVEEYVDASNLVWDQDAWFIEVIDSQPHRIGLSQQICRP